jgi:hypothetical protein
MYSCEIVRVGTVLLTKINGEWRMANGEWQIEH